MIYPKKKMIQVAGDGTKIRAGMNGGERIYSRADTKMAKAAKSHKDLIALGKFMISATRKQDARKPEFVEG
jgi:hypothetical protein